MPIKHYRYGSSTAFRTLNCHMWARHSENIPRPEASQAAQDGTAMHSMFEKAMRDPEYDPESDLGKVIEGVTVDETMTNKVWDAIELQDDFRLEHGLIVIPEHTLQASDTIGGTADLICWSEPNDIVAIGDLKTGDGQMVAAEGNSQLLFCAWLVVKHSDLLSHMDLNGETRFLLYIIQPSERRDDPLDVWETNLAEILEFGDKFTRAVDLAERGVGCTTTGPWCRFCPAEAVCPAKKEVIEQSTRLAVNSMELEQLNEALSIVDEVEAWCRAVRKLAHEQAEEGVKLDGWKLVQKRATRQWTDPGLAEQTARKMRLRVKDIMEMKLMTPAKLEKVCKKFGKNFDKLSEYVIMHSSGTTLAHADDPRPEVKPANALRSMAKRLNAKL